MRRWCVFFFLCLLVCGAGCSPAPKNQQRNDDPNLTAYRLIDDQRDDEAIELLENALSEDPTNYEYRVTLASAYAHKAGFKIQKLVPVFNAVEEMKKFKKKDDKAKKELKTLSARADKVALNISSLLVKFSKFLEIYSTVPSMTVDQAVYLRHAIYLLNGLGKDIRKEDALYRSVLEVVLFKHVWSEELMGTFIEPQKITANRCHFDLAQVTKSFNELGTLLIDIFNDIGYSNPKMAKSMKNLSKEVAEGVSNLTLASTSLIVIDEASNVFLQQMVIQQGFGKIIKCGGD